MKRWTNGLPGATKRLGAMMAQRGLSASQPRMRADTHDGPEQMLHVRGLIHCCSSHVRRSWSFCLATHGPGHTNWHQADLPPLLPHVRYQGVNRLRVNVARGPSLTPKGTLGRGVWGRLFAVSRLPLGRKMLGFKHRTKRGPWGANASAQGYHADRRRGGGMAGEGVGAVLSLSSDRCAVGVPRR